MMASDLIWCKSVNWLVGHVQQGRSGIGVDSGNAKPVRTEPSD